MTGISETTGRRLRVLLIYRALIPSIRVCGHCQLQWLEGQGKLEYRAIQELALSIEDMNWADIVVLGRLDSWYEHELATLLHRAGKYMLYILDDDLPHISTYVSSAAYYGQDEIRGYILRMIEYSKGLISPSPLLLEKYAGDGKQAIQLEEPAINPVQYSPRHREGPVRIGFAGSIDRIQDIDRILGDALTRIHEEYGDGVIFEFFGAIPSVAEKLGARCIPYTESYDSYRQTLNDLQWDIGLAPMPDTPFHACKHYNKFSEYAAAGIVGIFSDVYPYTRIKAFPECAVFCDNTPESWTQAIKALIGDPDRRERYCKQVIQCAREALSVPRSAAQLEAGLPDLATIEPAQSIRHAGLGFLKIRGMQKRLLTKIRGYGVKGAIEAIGRKTRDAIRSRH